jgi:hypothetical protein
MTRFPFEEDPRFRFGGFNELVRRYIFIGREPPAERRPRPKAAEGRRSTPLIDRSRAPAHRRHRVRDEFAIHAVAGGAS